ncbi:MAG: ferritin-like domain-containing protein [Leptolyngbyaceae cyanobacterium]
MTYIGPALTYTVDLAGACNTDLSWLQILQRIRTLRQRYITPEQLSDRLADLPHQFAQPTVRPWGTLPWHEVHADQLVGIEREAFCATLLGTINTEAPIRGYTQSSRQYLATLYPAMARFVGGQVDASGRLMEIGLWEREEKRHTPALAKLYTQLSGQRPDIVPHAARPYQPAADPRENLYRHGLHRVATEYGATCLYLWMMAHSTGALQRVLAELLIDEINHMTKFWGFGMWAYPDSSLVKIGQTLGRAMVRKARDRTTQGSLLHTLRRMMRELAWEQWSTINRFMLLYTFDQVIKPLWQWNQSLTPAYLNELFGRPNSTETARNC